MIDKSKSVKKSETSTSEKKPESAAKTLKSGLSSSADKVKSTPASSPARSTTPARSTSTSQPTARTDSDEIKKSAESGDRGRVGRRPQIQALGSLHETFGEENGEKGRNQTWVNRIGDILSGNEGKLRDRIGLDRTRVEKAEEAPAESKADSKPPSLWERLWGKKSEASKAETENSHEDWQRLQQDQMAATLAAARQSMGLDKQDGDDKKIGIGDSPKAGGAQNSSDLRDRLVDRATRNLTGNEREQVEAALDNPRIDTNLLRDITRDGFAIEGVPDKDGNLRDAQGNLHQGYYNYDDNKIRIRDEALQDPKLLQKVLNDELGHRIDDKLRSTPKTSEKWTELVDRYYKEEKKEKNLDENARKNQGEFASEAISAYLQGGKDARQLQESYPDLYDTIQATVGQSDRSNLTSGTSSFADRFQANRAAKENQLSGVYHTDSVQTPTRSTSTSATVPNPRPNLAEPESGGAAARVNRSERSTTPATSSPSATSPATSTPAPVNAATATPPPESATTTPPQTNSSDQVVPASTTANPAQTAASTARTTPDKASNEVTPAPNPQTSATAQTSSPTVQLAAFTTSERNTPNPNQGGGENTNQGGGNSGGGNPSAFAPQNFSGASSALNLTNRSETSGFGQTGTNPQPSGTAAQPSGTTPNQSTPTGERSPSPAGTTQPVVAQSIANPTVTAQSATTQSNPSPAATVQTPVAQPNPNPATTVQTPATQPNPNPAATAQTPAAQPNPNPATTVQTPATQPNPNPAATAQTPAATAQTPAAQPNPNPAATAQPPAAQPNPNPAATAQPPAAQPNPSPAANNPQPAANTQPSNYSNYSTNQNSYNNYNYTNQSGFDNSYQQNWNMSNIANYGDMLQGHAFDSLQMAQQELAHIDQSLLQNGTLQDLQGLAQSLEGLDKLQGDLKGMEELRDLAPVLKGLPEQLEGLESVHRMLDEFDGMPRTTAGLRNRPGFSNMLSELPQTTQRLQGLGEFARRGPQIQEHLQNLQELRQTSDTVQQIGRQAQELKQLPGQLAKVAEAMPTIRSAQQEGVLDGRPASDHRELTGAVHAEGRPTLQGDPQRTRPQGETVSGTTGVRPTSPSSQRPAAQEPLSVRTTPGAVGETQDVRVQGPGSRTTEGRETPRLQALNKLEGSTVDKLQRAPILTAKMERLPDAQRQLNTTVQALDKAVQPRNLAAAEKTVRDPQALAGRLERLEQSLEPGVEKNNVGQLRKTLQPVLSEPTLRQGLKQGTEALKPLAQPEGRRQLESLKSVQLDTPSAREVTRELKSPQVRQAAEKVSQGVSQMREAQRATEAQKNRMAELPPPHDLGDLGESLAKIVSDAQASNRSRTLFGIKVGGGGGTTSPAAAAPQGPAAQPQVARPAAAAPTRPSAPAASAAVTPKAASAPTPTTAPAAKPAPMPAQPNPNLAQPKEAMSKGRVDAYRQTYETMRDQLIGKGGKDHPWALVYHSRDAEGAKGLTDTLESTVVKSGSGKFQQWLGEMTRTPDSAVALSAILSNVAIHAPDRMVGILLLTTDGEGGKEAVGDAFNKMSQGVDSSLRLAHFLDTASQHPMAARGVAELLETLTEAKGESWSEATRTADTFRNLSETVGGARRLTQTFENLGELEGGNRLIARTINRMSRTDEGARSTLETLQNLAHDKEGASAFGKVLARATDSRDGARDLLTSLDRMSKKPAGQQDVARLFVRLSEGGQGARVLSNFVKDATNSGHLANLVEKLGQNDSARQMFQLALQQMANNPRERTHYEVFMGRVEASESLSAAVQSLSEEGDFSAEPVREAESVVQELRPRLEGRRPLEAVEAGDGQKRSFQQELSNLSESWRNERPSATSASAAGSLQNPEKAADPNAAQSNFRPGDVYSEETLRQAKICGDCGGRTTSLGWCPRCASQQQRQLSVSAV